MKALSSVIVLGIGFLMVSGSPARAQLGDMGDAVKKGAGDAVKQELMKGAAEKAGLPAPGAPAAAPAADTGAASAPAGEPQVAPAAAEAPAAANAPEGEPEVAPGAADAPGAAAAPGDAGAAQDDGGD
jgi:pyruvate dehydrogenase E2 component (dihydrolipoamide acetyltransferase)